MYMRLKEGAREAAEVAAASGAPSSAEKQKTGREEQEPKRCFSRPCPMLWDEAYIERDHSNSSA